jgi:hypothetical protein
MTARKPVAFIPFGESSTQMADKTRIIDQYLLQEYTPASASDASAPGVKFAYDSNYLYVQLETGTWKRASLSTW